MASSTPICYHCSLLNSTKAAAYWCFRCSDYLCDECEKKHKQQNATMEHKPITIDEYQNLPESVTTVQQECSDHNMKCDFYCKDHDVSCCLTCVSKNHKNCDDIQPLEEVIGNAKKSFLVQDLENRIKNIPEIIEQLLEGLAMEKARVNNDSQRVFAEIENTRERINQYLDTLQANLIEKVKIKQNDLLNNLEERAKDFEKFRAIANNMSSDLNKIEKNASKFHTYCSINAMAKTIQQYEDQINTLKMKSDDRFDSIELNISTELLRLTKDVDEFGSFNIHYGESPVFNFKKDQQAQSIIPNPEIQLKKILSFDIPREKRSTVVSGCCVMETGEMIFCDNNNGRLVKTSSQGEPMKTFRVRFQPRDVKPVDKSTVAITGGSSYKLVLINVNSSQIVRSVFVGDHCFGLCYIDDTFVVCTEKKKILTIDMQGHVLSTINTDGVVASCSLMNGKLYYTEGETDRVYCFDLLGNFLWKYDCEKGDRPIGIVVNQAEQVFVTCEDGKKVIFISKSGNDSKVVLTEKDGLLAPRSLYFCETNKSLLVCDGKGSCLIYKTRSHSYVNKAA